MEFVARPLLVALVVSIVICIFITLSWCIICVQSEYRKVHRQGGAVVLKSRMKGMEWKQEDLLSFEASLAQFPCTFLLVLPLIVLTYIYIYVYI